MDAMTPPDALQQSEREAPTPRGKVKKTPEQTKEANREAARRYRERHGLVKGAKDTGKGATPQADPDKPWETGTKAGTDEVFSEPGVKREPPKRRKAKTADPAEVAKLAQFLGAAHMMMANGMKMPEMALQEIECQALAGSLMGVMEQYDYTVDPKIAALVSLGVVAFGIYVPRMAAVSARVKAQRAQSQARQPQPMRDGGNAAQAGMGAPQRRQGASDVGGQSQPVYEPDPPQAEMYGAPVAYDGPAGVE
jgi:hypothetical protein